MGEGGVGTPGVGRRVCGGVYRRRQPEGSLLYRMKRPLPDGTTHLLFTGMELLRRLASLVPPPRMNLTRFHGVFAPGAKLRPFLPPAAARPSEEEAAAAGMGTKVSFATVVPPSPRPWRSPTSTGGRMDSHPTPGDGPGVPALREIPHRPGEAQRRPGSLADAGGTAAARGWRHTHVRAEPRRTIMATPVPPLSSSTASGCTPTAGSPGSSCSARPATRPSTSRCPCSSSSPPSRCSATRPTTSAPWR